MNATRRVLGAMLGLVIAGCAVSRHDQVKQKAERVESSLMKERDRVAALPASDGERGARLSHLSSLRYTLSAANVALGAVPYAIEEDKRPMAYDVLEEVYSTIDWNIPLGPAEQDRAMPAQFVGGALRLK